MGDRAKSPGVGRGGPDQCYKFPPVGGEGGKSFPPDSDPQGRFPPALGLTAGGVGSQGSGVWGVERVVEARKACAGGREREGRA